MFLGWKLGARAEVTFKKPADDVVPGERTKAT